MLQRTPSRTERLLADYMKSGVDLTKFTPEMRAVVIEAIKSMTDEQFQQFMQSRSVDGIDLHTTPGRMRALAQLCADGWQMTEEDRKTIKAKADDPQTMMAYLYARMRGVSQEDIQRIEKICSGWYDYDSDNGGPKATTRALLQIAAIQPGALDSAMSLLRFNQGRDHDETTGQNYVIMAAKCLAGMKHNEIDKDIAKFVVECATMPEQFENAKQFYKIKQITPRADYEKIEAFAEKSKYMVAPSRVVMKALSDMTKEQSELFGYCLRKCTNYKGYLNQSYIAPIAKMIMSFTPEQMALADNVMLFSYAQDPGAVLESMHAIRNGHGVKSCSVIMECASKEEAFTARDAYEHGLDEKAIGTGYYSVNPSYSAFKVIAAMMRSHVGQNMSAEEQRAICDLISKNRLSEAQGKLIRAALRTHPNMSYDTLSGVILIAEQHDVKDARQMIRDITNGSEERPDNEGLDEEELGDE